jgi:hypothetical protein
MAMRAPARHLAPDVRATLAPRAKVEAAYSVEPPRPAPPVSGADARQATPDAPLAAATPSPTQPTAEKKPGVPLRARRVGDKPLRLDVRIKDAQSRKVRPAIKNASKSAAASPRPAKASLPRTGIEKATRRIGHKADGVGQLLSAKAATRIVGVPQRRPRVGYAAAP